MLRKIEKLVFYTLIFLIPFQTRLVLRSWGIGFNEWNAAFFYLTDLLITALLLLWFLRQSHFYDISRKSDSQENSFFSNFKFSNYDWFLTGLIIVSAVSIIKASNQILGFYQLLKLIEFSLLYFYIKFNLGIVFNLLAAFFVFLASGIFQAILSILQYIRQSDLGLRFLGETVLNPDLFNVATFLVNGEKIMRSYGTAPHPNVLALILFLSIFAFYFLNKKSKIWILIYTILLFGFFFTFSRVIVFTWFVGFALFIKRLSKRTIITTLVVVVLFSVLFWPEVLARIKISPQEEALSLRGFYNQIAFQEKPFFGIGLGNFVNWFRGKNPGLASNFYQPVHNIYLLIFSETGILGLTAFLLFLFFLLKKSIHNSYLVILASILFFGLFDHFLWTLQQGQIILWLVLGLVSVGRPHSSTG